MAIDPSERITNWKASLFAYLAGLDVSGAPQWVFEGQRRTEMTQRFFARAFLADLAAAGAMHDAANVKVMKRAIVLQVDVYNPDGSEAETHDTYKVDRAADDIVHALTFKSIKVKDYATDPTGATETARASLRFQIPDRTRTHEDGYDRVRISAPGFVYVDHTL